MRTNHKDFIKLAFNLAKINLGKTALNPSVGCVIVKNNSVISSGFTSLNGRPHAEFNALKTKKKIKDSDLYVTMEPCVHYGLTPPCTNLIVKKGIKNVFYSFNDIDPRTSNKSKKELSNKNVKVKQIVVNDFKNFYDYYFLSRKNQLPLIDAKIAISKDYYTIRKGNKWITNIHSRKRVHLLRSEYNCILSTAKSINKDNSLLNNRLNGFNKEKPDLVIIDLNFKIKKNLDIFKFKKKRKILIVTNKFNSKKINFFKKNNVKIIKVDSLINKEDFLILFQKLNKLGYTRILIESGLKFLSSLITHNLVNNLYVFKSQNMLKKLGYNSISSYFIKKIRLNKKVNVNLDGDRLYKVNLKNV